MPPEAQQVPPANAPRRTGLIAALRSARSTLNTYAAWLAHRWRRSLQLRIVAATLGITLAVMLVVGYVLLTQIADGLLKAKQREAVGQSRGGVIYTINELRSVSTPNKPALRQVLARTATELAQRGSTAGTFDILLIQRSPDEPDDVVSNGQVAADEIPTQLRALVAKGDQATANATIDVGNSKQTVFIVGSAVPSELGNFELYYIFPLSNEQQTLSLIERTVFLAALALTLLIAGMGFLVSRLVVLPVRSAAKTAGRLASGELDRRMVVRGEDDLAQLATSFNNMAASLSEQINRLEGMSKLQQRFTSDVSHELRTPLTTVRMAAEVLYDYRDDFPAAAGRSAELLVTELDRFEALLKDLLEISRYDAGGLALEADATDAVALTERVVAANLRLAAEQNCDLVVSVPSEPVPVDMDSRRIERVLRNLIANALEHGAGTPVEITTAANATAVAITVRDHGIGLGGNDADHLFDRFWRADPSRARKLGGTGLGLAISLEDAKLHDGWLHVWGGKGAGASFRLTLPRVSGEPIVLSPLSLIPAGESGGSVGGDPRIWPIRDNQASTELTDEGHR